MPPRLRFTDDAARALRDAIAEAAHAAGAKPAAVEVFAIGDVEEGHVAGITVTCRGQGDRVIALVDRPRAGQVVIHNHPSADLRPSDPDLQLAHRYGEDGVGFVIVDNRVTRSNWVVEPHAPKHTPVDQDALERFFLEGLPKALPGWEPRPQQLDMAQRIAAAFDENRPIVVEAGTGTGKSLAYLVPAALWAKANEAKVAVSTYTRALQTQLLRSDLPLLAAGGLTATWSVLQGRNNYACRRRLGLADAEEEDTAASERTDLDALLGWASGSENGMRSDLPFAVDGAVWERVMSDSDLTLSTRCPHYDTCFYYQARRKAAASDLVVVNHALLMADRMLVDQLGRGVLPRVQRIVIDEAHHLEDAATGAGAHRLTALGVRRAALPLLDRKRRKGALTRLVKALGGSRSPLPPNLRTELEPRALAASQTLENLASTVQHLAEQIAWNGLGDGEEQTRRITDDFAETDTWNLAISPDVHHLSHELVRATEELYAVQELFSDVKVPEAQSQPLLDLQRAHRRLTDHAKIAADFLEPREHIVRWIEPARGRKGDTAAAICAAPVEVGALLQRVLWRPMPGTACTSATLSVNGRFSFWENRHGLTDAETGIIPSPFDHAKQALLGLPRDIPAPGDPGYGSRAGQIAIEAIQIADGGTFVLCTSYEAVRGFSRALRRVDSRPVLAQGEAGRSLLLERFRDNPRAVLVGTDSFWEGVSVRGDGLRLVIIPRLPFRVPTDPLRQARHERVRAKGYDPFLAYSLPEAVIKLRQGYGRLIRSKTDRGCVLILDRRIHERRYGAVMLRALPPARRVKAPWMIVKAQLERLFGERSWTGEE